SLPPRGARGGRRAGVRRRGRPARAAGAVAGGLRAPPAPARLPRAVGAPRGLRPPPREPRSGDRVGDRHHPHPPAGAPRRRRLGTLPRPLRRSAVAPARRRASLLLYIQAAAPLGTALVAESRRTAGRGRFLSVTTRAPSSLHG